MRILLLSAFLLLVSCVQQVEPITEDIDETSQESSEEIPAPAPSPVPSNIPKAAQINSIVRSGDNYILNYSLASDSLSPAGGFDSYINGVDQNDNSSFSGFTRVYTGLDKTKEQCFEVQAKYTQLSPAIYLISNRVCVAGEMVPAPTLAPEPTPAPTPMPNKIAKAAVINSVVKSGDDYVLKYSLASDALEPAGGFDSYINGADQNDRSRHSGLTRTYSNLDKTIEQCFELQARYSELNPAVYLMSNKICVEGEVVSMPTPAPTPTPNPEPSPTPTPEPAPPVVTDKLKAFPSAFGGGSEASGGRGGVLVIVNTLNAGTPLSYDSQKKVYSGGLRAALSQNIGPRYIIFNVSGNIDISGSDLTVSRDDITIFGQSAPRGGITIHGDNIQFNGVDNIIVRYIRSRNGSTRAYDSSGKISDDQSSYGFKINGGNNIILDHVTASWGGDKSILIGTNQDVSQMGHTVQRSILSNSHTYMQLSMQNPANFNQRDKVSCLMNVFMRGSNRTPNIGGTGGFVEVKNNVIQSTGTKFGVIQWSDNAYVNWSDNYYKIPSGSTETNEFQRSSGKYSSTPYTQVRLYTQRNIYENTNGFILDGTEKGKDSNARIWTYRLAGVANDTPIDRDLLVPDPHNGIANPLNDLSANEAYDILVNKGHVGASHYMDDNGMPQYYMDPLDADGLNDIKKNTMKRHGNRNDWILPNIPSSVRPSSYDSDQDGMSDAWELRTFGSLAQDYNGDHDNDGYTNIEEFLNQVDY